MSAVGSSTFNNYLGELEKKVAKFPNDPEPFAELAGALLLIQNYKRVRNYKSYAYHKE